MRFSLRQLMSGVAAVGILLAVSCWHPLLALCLIATLGLPVLATCTVYRTRTILIAAIPAAIALGFMWVESFELSLSAGWGPTTSFYQVTTQQGRILLFRFHYKRGSGNWVPWIENDRLEPPSTHWSDWPGFHEEHYLLRLPGFELAHSEYVVPFGSRSAVDSVEVLTISYWLSAVLFTVMVAALALWVHRGATAPARAKNATSP